ncbi:MAG: glycosyltransferase, partial [Bacteroidetes bacterium]|nr:glycosyltransferase [Bacteroidota bacterium]
FKQPVAIIPWGIDFPETITNTDTNKKHILYLGRIHPNKGLDLLIKIWAKLEKEFSDWELHIVGPEIGFFDDETSYLNHLKNLCKTFSLKRVKFKNAVFGNEKNEHYQRASFTVLLSHSENFAMTVAESLACGTPSIVSKSAPWSGLDITNSGYWVDMDEETVLIAFKKAMSLDENEVALMGNNAREWMKKEFSWDNISEQFNQAYEWAANNSLTKPEFIKLD